MEFYTFLPKLLNMSLTAGVAIVFVLLLRLLLKKAPKVISYALWGVVLFRLLCPVSIEADISLFGLMDAPTTKSASLTSRMEYVPENIVHTEFPTVALPLPDRVNSAVNEVLPSGREQTAADPLEGPMFLAVYGWLAGVLAMTGYGAASVLRLRGKLLTASPLRENIYLADEIESPFVMGLFRPKIYLPSGLKGRERECVICHEQHHIRRRDPIIKALAFLALSLHWFNPLVWTAFVCAGRDMEMSCDEAVMKQLGSEVRAEYCASLLSLATGRRILAGAPLAFGEGDTGERIRNLAAWKKPGVWAVAAAAAACIALTAGLVTNPAEKSEFPLTGSNVSEMDTEQVVECIAKAEGLKDGTQLYVNGANFEVMLTEDLDWAEDGAINFFYPKDQKTYSAQLRIFREEGTYFVTERTEWHEEEQQFKLFLYLEALRYMPQAEIRRLAPEADRYAVNIRPEGTPQSYDRVLEYGKNGVESAGGWYIHLEVQPLYEAAQGGYSGRGEEQIHLFYHGEGAGAKLTPGTNYISRKCLYMNPMSSYIAIDGDSGYRYGVQEDHFEIIGRGGGEKEKIAVPNWEWQEFPYTDEEWALLYSYDPTGGKAVEHISELYKERLCLPLTEHKMLLKMDNELWLVELLPDKQMGTALWSIYSLVPEEAVGTAWWEYTPWFSSRMPVMPLRFDMDCSEISAVCEQGLLVDWEAEEKTESHQMTCQKGERLYWLPEGENEWAAQWTKIHITVTKAGGEQYTGGIYLERQDSPGQETLYKISPVGEGLYITQDSEQGEIVITAAPKATAK